MESNSCHVHDPFSHFGIRKENSAFTTRYCPFDKHANSKVQKLPSQLRFSLPSIIITSTSNEPWNTETHKTDSNPRITDQKPWPFEPVKVKFCFLRGPLRWLTAAKNAIVNWPLNFRIRMFVKSAVTPRKYAVYFTFSSARKTWLNSALSLVKRTFYQTVNVRKISRSWLVFPLRKRQGQLGIHHHFNNRGKICYSCHIIQHMENGIEQLVFCR